MLKIYTERNKRTGEMEEVKYLTMIDPYSGKFVTFRNPHDDTILFYEILMSEMNLVRLKEIVSDRISSDPHSSYLFAMNDILSRDSLSLNQVARLNDLLHRKAFNLSKHKEVKEDDNNDQDKSK